MTVEDGARSPIFWSTLFSGLPEAGSPASESLLAFLHENSSATLAALPWVAAEIAGHEGFEAMLSFVRARGGQRLYVASDTRRCEDALTIPIRAVTHRRVLNGAGSTGLIDAPSGWGVFLALRRVAIEDALKRGATEAVVARAFGVTTRALRKARSRA